METQPERQVEGFEMLGERNLMFCTKPHGKFNQDEKKKKEKRLKQLWEAQKTGIVQLKPRKAHVQQ